MSTAEASRANAGTAPARRSRAREFRDLLAGLAQFDGVQGGLLVTPDGLVITSALPADANVDALAALGATLGRQLERGTEPPGAGGFTTAVFAADDGTLLIGGSRIGYVVLLGGPRLDAETLRAALGDAVARLSS